MDFNHKLIKQLTAVTLSASLVGCGGEITQLGGTLFGNDTEAVPAFSQEFFAGRTGFMQSENAPGYIPIISNAYTFNEDGTGTKYENRVGSGALSTSFAWSTDTEGLMTIDGLSGSTSFPSCFSSIIASNFPQDVVDQVTAACNQGLFLTGQVELRSGISQEQWQLTQSHSSRVEMSVAFTQTYTLIIPQEVIDNVEGGWQVDEQPTVDVPAEPFDTTFGYQPAAGIEAITETDLTGDWVIPVRYTLPLESFFSGSGVTDFFQDRLSIDGGSASGKLSGNSYAVSVTENGFSLTRDNETLDYTLYAQLENEYTVMMDYQVNGITEHIYVSNIMQVDGTASNFTQSMVTELPQVYNASINASITAFRNDVGLPSLDSVAIFAYQFREDGTFRRGIAPETGEFNPDITRPVPFFQSFSIWDYSADNNTDIISTSFDQGFRVRNRTWEVLGVNSFGKTLVFEYSTWLVDTDFDGIPDTDQWFIEPRINYFELLDLSNYPDAWSNTDLDEDGLYNSEEVDAGTDFDNPDSDGDGLNDGDEVKVYQTNPNNIDSDGDTFSDFEEVSAGTDPNDSESTPIVGVFEVDNGVAIFHLLSDNTFIAIQKEDPGFDQVGYEMGTYTAVDGVLTFTPNINHDGEALTCSAPRGTLCNEPLVIFYSFNSSGMNWAVQGEQVVIPAIRQSFTPDTVQGTWLYEVPGEEYTVLTFKGDGTYVVAERYFNDASLNYYEHGEYSLLGTTMSATVYSYLEGNISSFCIGSAQSPCEATTPVFENVTVSGNQLTVTLVETQETVTAIRLF